MKGVSVRSGRAVPAWCLQYGTWSHGNLRVTFCGITGLRRVRPVRVAPTRVMGCSPVAPAGVPERAQDGIRIRGGLPLPEDR